MCGYVQIIHGIVRVAACRIVNQSIYRPSYLLYCTDIVGSRVVAFAFGSIFFREEPLGRAFLPVIAQALRCSEFFPCS